ncbi:MAG: hypothetical protein IT279_14995 [Ignavibacteriaceae bacterium]|nr:hypothetical protein [Ignavibacteriaceae bacterium]
MQRKYLQHIWVIEPPASSLSAIEFREKLATIKTKSKAIRYVENLLDEHEVDGMVCIELVSEPANRFFLVYPAPWRRGKNKVVFQELTPGKTIQSSEEFEPF